MYNQLFSYIFQVCCHLILCCLAVFVILSSYAKHYKISLYPVVTQLPPKMLHDSIRKKKNEKHACVHVSTEGMCKYLDNNNATL